MHRISSMWLRKSVVYILAAEQLFFHFPPQCRADARVSTEICHRLMEALWGYRKTMRGIEDLAGAFLD